MLRLTSPAAAAAVLAFGALALAVPAATALHRVIKSTSNISKISAGRVGGRRERERFDLG
jgi:hypothetical protein